MVRMFDVAQRADVSVSTVSHVINGTRFVGDETRAAVLAAIRETGYNRFPVHRAAAANRTRLIGLVISAISNIYFADIVRAIETDLRGRGYVLLLTETHENARLEIDIVQALHERCVDGILLAPVTDEPSKSLEYLQEMGIPCVLVDRCVSDRFDRVGTENVKAVARLTSHLAEKRHKRIALISGKPGVRTTEERIQGYCDAMSSYGLQELIESGESQADGA